MPKGYSKYNQGGWKHSKKSISLMSENRIGLTMDEKNPRWMGDNVTYQALHNWVRKNFIKGLTCELCKINPGKDKRGHTKLQWSNKNKKYTRKREDWWNLCPPCHRKYDIKNKVKHKYERR